MKKIHYLYADFETTTISDEVIKPYTDYKEYYKNTANPKTPEIYDWCVSYDKEYKDVVKKDHYVYEHPEVKAHYNINADTFINFIENINVDAVMFFNNLKGYDGHFLIPELDKHGYKNVLSLSVIENNELHGRTETEFMERYRKIKDMLLSNPQLKRKFLELGKEDGVKYLKNLIKKQWDKLLPNEYSVIANGNSQIYEIKIGLPSYKRKGKGSITTNRALIIRDNLTIFPTSIKKMGETLVKQNKGKAPLKELEDKYLKKELSTAYTRTDKYKSVKELQADGNELDYLIQDTYILWSYHKEIEKYFPRNEWKLTIGSTAYKNWNDTLGKRLIKHYLAKGLITVKPRNKGIIDYLYKGKIYNTRVMGDVLVKTLLPTDWLDKPYTENQTIHNYLYKWYSGGITIVNEEYRGQLVDKLTFLDINSSYPSQQVKDVQVPIGTGVKGDYKPYDFKFYTLTVKNKIVNKYGLPFLHSEYAEKREYLTTLLPNQTFKFTSITLPRFLKYYNPKNSDYTLKVEYSFMSTSIKNIFEDFVTPWYEIKEQASKDGNEVLKTIAKLFLNSNYGKFGTKSNRDSKYWNQEYTQWEDYEQTLKSKYYLPLAIVITELGRMNLVDAVDVNYKNFVYCDTDSIAVLNFKPEDYKNIELDPYKIGKWDIEHKNMYGIFRRPKQYMLLSHDNKYKAKQAFAGINFNRVMLDDDKLKEIDKLDEYVNTLTLTDFIIGKTIPNQLTPNRILGAGIILEEREKRIKPVWDYEPLTEQTLYKEEHFQETLFKLQHLNRQSVIIKVR